MDDTRISRTEIIRKQKWEEKQLNGCLKRQTSDISHEKTLTCLSNFLVVIIQFRMKVTVITIVIGALGTVTKKIEDLELRERMDTIQTTTLLRSARILRGVQET